MPGLRLPRVRCNNKELESILNEYAEAIERALNKGDLTFGPNMVFSTTERGAHVDSLGEDGEEADEEEYPFRVIFMPPPEGQDPGSKGWFKVQLNSNLSFGMSPKDKVVITGLDEVKQLELTGNEKIWLKVDLSATHTEPPGDITAEIDFGDDWNGDDGNFYPHPVQFDTDDGTSNGSGDEPPDNKNQIAFYVPIAETMEVDDSDPYQPKGWLLNDSIQLYQLLRTHLLIAETCYSQENGTDQVKLAMPWWAHFYYTDI